MGSTDPKDPPEACGEANPFHSLEDLSLWTGGQLGCLLRPGMAQSRGKEHPWNNVIAAGAAGGLIPIHRGLRASAAMAFVVGAVVALYEGSVIMVYKLKEAKLSRAKFLV
ncbi:hypothetical protein FEM48_Zijuj09G0176900 [Ziziphus jujuba var. spinosa]|uniref:Uncharacterized protein n=1 Tax=Ziziphus jujuba var. spinosa TaxID=714518 RepID=A0A978UUE0_ZIZJJ|nr:hypothetical protein FEM48_Zijuj09G0176900 [Ziziphus jujuba var. spinosa]